MNAVSEKPARSGRKAKGDGHLRRAEILGAAERIFLDYGYEGATIRKIADAVGVSSTALYMHFTDKTQILVEICEGMFAQLLAQNTEIAALDMDPVQRVRLMLDAFMDFAMAHPNAYSLIYCPSPAQIGEANVQAITGVGQQCYDVFAAAVQQAIDAGRLRVKDVQVASQTLWTAVHGLAMLLISRPTLNWAPTHTLKAAMLDSLFEGMVAR